MQMSSDDAEAAANCRPGFPQQEKKKKTKTRKPVAEDGGKTDGSGFCFPGAVRRVSFIYRDVQKNQTDAWKKVSDTETHEGYVAVILSVISIL